MNLVPGRLVCWLFRGLSFTFALNPPSPRPTLPASSSPLPDAINRRAVELQTAVYRIAQAADQAPTLDDLFRSIHASIASVMPAGNFYIALYDEQADLISFPYFVDEFDVSAPPHKPRRGLTEYVLRTGRSLLCTLEIDEALRRAGEIELLGAPSRIWLGCPLIVDKKTIGVMAVQHYSDPAAYGEQEQRMLEFVSSEIARAIEHKRAQDALVESERRFRALIENSADAVSLLDAEGRILYTTPSSARVLGFRPEELQGRSALDLVHPDDSELVASIIEKLLADPGQRIETEFRCRHKDGSWQWLESMSQNLLTEPGVQALVVNYRNVTERKEAEAALARRAEQLALLYDAGLALNSVLEPATQLEFLLRIALRTLRADRAEFFRLDPTRKEIRLEFAFGYPADRLELLRHFNFSVNDTNGIIPTVYRERLPLNLPDVLSDPRCIVVDPEMRSGLWVPVEHENQLLGVLGMLSARPQAFSAQDERLLALFANQAAVALENARLFDETRRRADQLAVLNRIANAASRTLQLDELLTIIHDEITAALSAQAFFIALYDETTDELDYRIRIDRGVRAPLERRPAHGATLTNYAISSRRPLLIRDYERERDSYPAPRLWGTMEWPRSFLVVPMMVGEEVVGIISIQSYEPNAYSEEDLRLLMTIADQVALVIRNARLFEAMQQRLGALQAVGGAAPNS